MELATWICYITHAEADKLRIDETTDAQADRRTHRHADRHAERHTKQTDRQYAFKTAIEAVCVQNSRQADLSVSKAWHQPVEAGQQSVVSWSALRAALPGSSA